MLSVPRLAAFFPALFCRNQLWGDDLRSRAGFKGSLGSSCEPACLVEATHAGPRRRHSRAVAMSTQARPSAKGRMGGSQKKYARGDYVNILMGVEDAPEVNPRGLPFDPLAMVATGLKDLHGEMGPDAVLRRRRAERAKLPRPTAPTEKAKPTLFKEPTVVLGLSVKTRQEPYCLGFLGF
ncbi:unnamed protein product [Symbiodinium sp. KB8]|nr:unnamed protein product [Symbiodinium sp. KB8]